MLTLESDSDLDRMGAVPLKSVDDVQIGDILIRRSSRTWAGGIIDVRKAYLILSEHKPLPGLGGRSCMFDSLRLSGEQFVGSTILTEVELTNNSRVTTLYHVRRDR